MALIKVRKWQLLLTSIIVLPILRKITDQLEKRAATTPEEWDDVLAGAFKTVVEFLSGPDAFEET